MVKVTKRKTQFGYLFDIFIDEEVFQIYFAGNLDLYWKYQYKGRILTCDDSKSFFITKENFFLFQLFDKLYNKIKHYNIYKGNEFRTTGQLEDLRQSLIDFDPYQYDLLFHDDKIEWHCDDCIYEEASVFIIEKVDDFYKLTFKKGMVENFLTYAVRIRNSGSRYNPFNIAFMNMYNQLCEYETDYHQIHMEEYLYQKKLIRKKETI